MNQFWLKKDPHSRQKLRSILTYVLPVIVIHLILLKVTYALSSIPFDSYYKSSISLELLAQTIESKKTFILSFLFLIVFFVGFRLSWNHFENGKTLRKVILITALILGWYYATYDINFYFNQSHLGDRLLLILLAATIFWKPIFIVPFLILLFTIIFQSNYLIGYSGAASPFLLTRVLNLFLAFIIYRLLFKKFKFSIFMFLLCCLIGSHYFLPGLGKFNLEWILNDQISYMIPGAYNSGWLSFISEESISNFIRFFDRLDLPLRGFTLLVECGVLFFFCHIKYMRFVFTGAIIMHLGIFIYTGILFWMWILLLILVLIFILKKDFAYDTIFNKYFLIASIFIIGAGKYWTSAGALSWHDSPLSYSHIIEAKTENGNIVKLPSNFFSAYSYQFASSDFKFLNDEPRLPIVWGATNKSTASYFNLEHSLDEVFHYEKEKGKIYKNESSKQIFIDFLKTFIANRNRSNKNSKSLLYVKAPDLYWTFPYNTSFKINERITEIKISEITSYYTFNEGFQKIRTKELLNLTIED